MRRTILAKLRDRVSFYEWAYGRLAEADSDLGPVAEFLVGSLLKCLPSARRVNATYDLVLPGGRTLEVKATAKRQAQSKGAPIYRWNVGTQLANPGSPIADFFLFLRAEFPATAATSPRFDVFDAKYWKVRVVAGSVLASTGVTRSVTENLLNRLDIPERPLSALRAVF